MRDTFPCCHQSIPDTDRRDEDSRRRRSLYRVSAGAVVGHNVHTGRYSPVISPDQSINQSINHARIQNSVVQDQDPDRQDQDQDQDSGAQDQDPDQGPSRPSPRPRL